MEIALLVITSLSLITNLLLVNHLMGTKCLEATIETIDLPLPPAEEVWQDAADEPAAVPVTVPPAQAAWENKSGIQQSLSAPPAPPIVKEQLPPLARPAGFV